MPLFYQHNINGSDRLGVWNIAEDESFFQEKVPLHRNISHERKRLQHLAGRYLLQYLYADFPYELIEIAETRRPFIKNESYHFSISHCGDFAAAIVSKVNRVGVDIELVTPMIEKISYKFLNREELASIGDVGLQQQVTSHNAPDTNKYQGRRHEVGGGPEGHTLADWQLQTSNFKPPTSNLSPERRNNNEPSQASKLEWLTMLWSAKEAVYKWYGDGLVDFKKHIHYTGVYQEADDEWIELFFIFQKQKPVPLTIRSRFFGMLVVSYVKPSGLKFEV